MRHDHPVFSRVYARLCRLEEAGAVGRARAEVAAALSGRVLIVGLGPASDLRFLPAGVAEVVGIEPSASMRREAEAAVAQARESGLTVEVIDAVAEDLPLPDASCDSALLGYVMCSVDDPARAAAELRRVVRPGGTVGVIEHVAGEPGSWLCRCQRGISPLWGRFAGGCHPDRDTRAVLAAAGFDVSGLRDERLVPVPPVSPALVGTAVAP
ncbi:MAG: class I SAM-dependent methyltransferase [Candidatus Nanopelagicales bacterium]